MPVILTAGLKASHKDYEDYNEEDIKRMAQESIKKLNEAGFEIQPYFIDEENPNTLDEWKDLLRSRKWDGVGLGFGVRGDSNLTPMFEKLVNAVLENVSPAPKMMFPVGPDKVYEATMRVFKE